MARRAMWLFTACLLGGCAGLLAEQAGVNDWYPLHASFLINFLCHTRSPPEQHSRARAGKSHR